MVGDSPRKIVMWKEVVRNVRNRLNEWRGRHLSIGGRVVLLNSVIYAIPLYSLSFYRAPRKVIKEFIGIQRRFLWRGVEGGQCVNWVSWKVVGKSREEGGLGIRDIDSMNVSLVMKWKWRILMEDNAVWCDLLRYRWCGEQALSETYPELYARATTPFMSVADVEHWEEEEWTWVAQHWFSIDDDKDQFLIMDLLDHISNIQLVQGERYIVVWAANENEGFSVKSCAIAVRSRMEIFNGGEDNLNKLKFLWKIEAPSKVKIFVWRLVLDRNPTRQQLK
ncbi:uncharacterized protein LOC131623820 [Vicia villosa]|uniref:uncharacterized protein LOC131623820 n=1 Tax=Vicia villosa TaxID=3911 RepID=UPI00273B6EE9|nr:uncharacterized protein LOC131623820 [Vicia villosa]